LTLEGGTDRLSQNFSSSLPINAAENGIIAKTSFAPWGKTEVMPICAVHYSNLFLPTDFSVLKTIIHLCRIFKCLALKSESFEDAGQTKCSCVSIF
jgi:hypothetical protein